MVWSAPLFAMAFSWHTLQWGLVGFWAFSFTASGFYVVNDLMDRARDRLHPVKQHRPIASGVVSVGQARSTAALLLGIGLGLGWLGGWAFLGWLLAYIVLQIGYNLFLKHQPILDVLGLAMGYVLRALAGAAIVGVPVSAWFMLCLGLLACFLGIEKRKAERKAMGETGQTRAVLQAYTFEMLHRMENLVASATLMSYALWTIEASGTMGMLITIPFVLYGLMRYQMLTEMGAGETPELDVFRDAGMRWAFAGWLITVLYLLAQR